MLLGHITVFSIKVADKPHEYNPPRRVVFRHRYRWIILVHQHKINVDCYLYFVTMLPGHITVFSIKVAHKPHQIWSSMKDESFFIDIYEIFWFICTQLMIPCHVNYSLPAFLSILDRQGGNVKNLVRWSVVHKSSWVYVPIKAEV